ETTSTIEASVKLITDLSRNMNIIIGRSTNESYIQVAMLSLTVFKSRIYELIAGEKVAEEMLDNIRDHAGSRLGQWYFQGLGHSTFGHLQNYKNLEQHLEKMHHCAFEALQASQGGLVKDKLKYLAEMDDHSQILIKGFCGLNTDLQAMVQAVAEGGEEDVLF
ncbi:MAG: CZB domain-containing protein, partial [Bermanella sp.]